MQEEREEREKNLVFEEDNQDQEECTQMVKNVFETMKNMNETEQLKRDKQGK